MRDIRLVVITPHDPEDRRHWSGTPHYLLKALRTQFSDIEVISGAQSSLILKAIRRVLRPWRIDPLREMLTARVLGRLNAAKIRRLKPDLVFGVAASHMIAALKVDAPMIHFSDATFMAVLGYYREFSNFSPRTVREGNAMEGAALRAASLALMTSPWAAKSAIEDYGAAPAQVVSLPMGANIEHWPDWQFAPRTDQVLRLLFVGVDWQRKGGDIAIDVLRNLKARGLEVELHVVGCDPPAEFDDGGLRRHGFLRKSVPSEYATLEALYRTSSVFLLPTRAEAYGLVFAEASAYGLPIVARRTGGVPSVVEEGVNGALMDEAAGADAYADWIFEHWTDAARFEELRKSSRSKFERQLNWEAWGEAVGRLAEDLVARAGRT